MSEVRTSGKAKLIRGVHDRSSKAEKLYGTCDQQQFSFQTTDELESLTEIVGQPRVVGAVEFGIGIRQQGYNLFVSGPTGIGKRWTVRHLLQQRAASEPKPSDWCYVNNFAEPARPLALALPPGQGVALRQDVERLVQELRSTIPAVFESEEYRARKQAIEIETKSQQARFFEELRSRHRARGLVSRAPLPVSSLLH